MIEIDDSFKQEIYEKLAETCGSRRFERLWNSYLRHGGSIEGLHTIYRDATDEHRSKAGGDNPVRDVRRLIAHKIKAELRSLKNDATNEIQKPKKKIPHYLTIGEFIKEITPVDQKDEDLVDGGIKKLDSEYSKAAAPWPELFSNAWFISPTVKQKQDSVPVRYKLADGHYLKGTLHRAARYKGDYLKRIATTEDRDILKALSHAWSNKPGWVHDPADPNDSSKWLCHVTLDINTIGELIGYRHNGRDTGGAARKYIRKRLFALEDARYWLEFDLNKEPGFNSGDRVIIEGEGFVSRVQIFALKKGRGQKAAARILFGNAWSQQLLHNHAVHRSIFLLNLNDPTANKIAEYLERLPRRPNLQPVSFTKLIKIAYLDGWEKWGKWKSHRGRLVKTIEKLDGKQFHEKWKFKLHTLDGGDDFYLYPGFEAVEDENEIKIPEGEPNREVRLDALKQLRNALEAARIQQVIREFFPDDLGSVPLVANLS